MKITKRLLKPAKDFSWEGNTGEAIVLHTTLGHNYKGAEDTLKARHLSYHYIIDEKGTIYQLVDTSRSAWHAGVKSNPNLRVRSFFGEGNPNRRSIGIAFVGMNTMDFTDAQRDAAVWLIKEIGKKTGVRYNTNNIFYHQEITDYKPKYVEYIRDKVVEALVGFKDEKDNVPKKSTMALYMELLQNYLSLMLIKLQEA